MAYFGHFWANFMHVVHKTKFVIFCTKLRKWTQKPKNKHNIYYTEFVCEVLYRNSKNKHNILYIVLWVDCAYPPRATQRVEEAEVGV